MTQPTANPRVSNLLRALTWVEVAVVGAAAGLFTVPWMVIPFWPWKLTPFNAYFVGSAYFTAWFPLVFLAWTGRWNPGRLVLPMIGTFTAYVLLVSLLHLDVFLWDRVGTWVWWVLYVVLPVNSAVHMGWYRRWEPAEALPTPQLWNRVLTTQAVATALYGLAMFVAPEPATKWWPWPMNAFNGRMYAVVFFSVAIGSWVVRRRASRFERFTQGLTGLTLGATVIGGLIKTDVGLGRIAWQAPATIAWLGLFAVVGAIGVALMATALAQPEAARHQSGQAHRTAA